MCGAGGVVPDLERSGVEPAAVVGGLWGRRRLTVRLRLWGTCHGPLRTLSICPQGPLLSDLYCSVEIRSDVTPHGTLVGHCLATGYTLRDVVVDDQIIHL